MGSSNLGISMSKVQKLSEKDLACYEKAIGIILQDESFKKVLNDGADSYHGIAKRLVASVQNLERADNSNERVATFTAGMFGRWAYRTTERLLKNSGDSSFTTSLKQ